MALENEKKKNDLILVAALLAIALIYFAGSRVLADKNAARAVITVNGEVAGTYPLSEDIEDMVIETGVGDGTVHISIKDGSISVTQSSCPDKICVKQGSISQSGQTIVCLPNRVVVTVQ